MEKTIFLKEVLELMDKKDSNGKALPFDIVVREFSRTNKTGGKIKYYNDARKLIASKKGTKERNIFMEVFKTDKCEKSPNHFENMTRNLELANGKKCKINILFIIKFNNIQVVY